MLVLSRKAGQGIQIGDNVLVTVTAIKGNRVALGRAAPNEVSIRRGELIPVEPEQDRESTTFVNRGKQVA